MDAKDPEGNLGSWNKKVPLGLWDSENCPIPTGHDPVIILKALRGYLESFGFDSNVLLLGVVGDLEDGNRIPKKVVDALTTKGVEFSSAKKDAEGKVPQDAADHVIVKKLKRFESSLATVPLIVIAGDGIYSEYLKTLESKYNVLWIYPKSKTSPETIRSLSPFAIICYEDLMWTYMRLEHRQSGTGPVPRRGGFGGNRGKRREQRMRMRMEEGRGKMQKMEEHEQEEEEESEPQEEEEEEDE